MGWGSIATGLLGASMLGQAMAEDPESPGAEGDLGTGWSLTAIAGTTVAALATGALVTAYWWSQRRPARPQFSPAMLATPGSEAHNAMTQKHPLNEGILPTTCYDAGVFSLTLTDGLSPEVCTRWRFAAPKANTYQIVDPAQDRWVTDPDHLPADSIIIFYRRFRPGERSALEAETNGRWVPFHMVRTLDGRMVVGANNGDRMGTTPTWSENDIGNMFDWSGTENTQSVWTAPGLPAPDTFSVDGIEKYVAFYAPISTVIKRLNAAFP
ncbi:hypothetical protein [Sorangium sp. So ce385]|uniref:hypothetical protein n=1 Tax=Sorangium sp. So ce385 TaxID=3133308 RepID=UPI003F5AEC0B